MCCFRHHIVEEIASAVADTDLSCSNLSPQTFSTTTSTAPSISIEPPSPTETTPSKESNHDVARPNSTSHQYKRYRSFSETKDAKDSDVMHAAFVADGRKNSVIVML